MTRGQPSIRLPLLVAGAAGIVLALLLAASGPALQFGRHVERGVAADLHDRLEHVASLVEIGADERPAMAAPPRDPAHQRPYSGHYWQVAGPGAEPEDELRSRSLWDYALPLPADAGPTWQGALPGPAGELLLALVRRVELVVPGSDVPLRIAVAVDRAEIDAARAGFLLDLAPCLALLALALTAALAAA